MLSGGSAFGLDAASGVVDRLRALGRGFRAGAAVVPIVPAAILFDLANGGEKEWAENPYPALGRRGASMRRRRTSRIGSVGAGTGAMTATLMGGLGSASIVTEDGVTVGALAAVNAFGGVCVPGSRAFWAGACEIGDEFGGLGPGGGAGGAVHAAADEAGAGAIRRRTPPSPSSRPTRALDKAGARRLAEVAQGGLARAIHPAHTPFDGDLVFAVSTGAARRRDAPGA